MNQEQTAVLQDTESPRRVIIAGAGSGKTRTLVADVVQTIQAGTDPAEIVVITFTNAAAAEFRHRLAEHVDTLPGFVGTLHAWCLLLLNRHGAAIGYKAPVQMIDQETEERLIKEALASIKAAAKWSVGKVREWKATGGIGNPAAIAAGAYMRRMRAASTVDFDSVLFETLRLIEGGHVPALAALYVDEFQDSGPWDAAIYKALTVARLFVVGDPCQSVYGFRGAVVQNIIELATSLDWQPYWLTTNHRCPTLAIDGANRLMQHGQTAKVFRRMEPHTTAPVGRLRVWKSPTPLAEAASIAGHIREADTMPTAVLVRYNAQIPAIVDALTAEGFTVAVGRSEERPWLALAISALNAIANPDNELAASTWLAFQWKDDLSLLQANAARAGRSVAREAFKSLGVESRRPEEQLGAMGLPPEASDAIVAAWPPGAAIFDVIQQVQEDAKPPEPPPGAVYVGTIHSYKGREAERVVLAGMADEIMPATKTGDTQEEERRLFYVALTRCRRELWITRPDRYLPPFGKEYKTATRCRFVAEAFPEIPAL